MCMGASAAAEPAAPATQTPESPKAKSLAPGPRSGDREIRGFDPSRPLASRGDFAPR